MKKRIGWVSNSSSSSFVCVGFKKDPYHMSVTELTKMCRSLGVEEHKLTKDAEDLRDMLMDSIDRTDYTWYTEEGIIGKEIAEGEYELEQEELGIQEIIKLSEEIVKKFGVDKEEISLITGSYAC